jgi:hypothetical protein
MVVVRGRAGRLMLDVPPSSSAAWSMIDRCRVCGEPAVAHGVLSDFKQLRRTLREAGEGKRSPSKLGKPLGWLKYQSMQ